MVYRKKCYTETDRGRCEHISTISILYISVLGPFVTILPQPFIFNVKSKQFISLIAVEALILIGCTIIYFITKWNNKGFKEKEFI